MGSAAFKILEQIDPIAMLRETGQKLDMDFAKRCVMLVKTIDGILGLGNRKATEFDAPYMHAATRVLDKWPKEKVEVVLLRMFQKKNSLGLTKRTSWILDHFDEVVAKVAHPDGYDKWLTLRTGHVEEAR